MEKAIELKNRKSLFLTSKNCSKPLDGYKALHHEYQATFLHYIL